MKTVSQNFKLAQSSNLIYPVRKVELFRFLPDGSGWDTTAIDVTMEVVKLDRLSWKLDTDALNEFKTSNLAIEVDNSDRRWDDGSPSRFAGFLRFNSKIRISLGLTVAGAPEIFPVFTGTITNTIERTPTPTLQLDVQSMDQFLAIADANKAAILVTNELLGTGDGSTFQFTLSQTPVGIINEVRVGGVVLRPGLRWTASGLNDPTKKAVVAFNSIVPAAGQPVNADYVVWKREQQIQQVVKNLLASVPQILPLEIDTVTFNPPVQREILHTTSGDFAPYSLVRAVVLPENPPPDQNAQISMDAYDSAAKWLAAVSLTRINTTRIPGGIHPQWTAQYEGDRDPNVEKYQIDGDPSFPWSEFVSQGASVSLANSIRTVDYTATSGFYSLYNQKNDVGYPYWSSRSAACRLRIDSLSGTIYMAVSVPGSNIIAAIKFQNPNQVRVVTNNAQGPNIQVTATQFHVYRLDLILTSASTGTYQFFIDGAQVDSGALGPLSSPPFFAGTIELQGNGTFKFDLDFLRLNSLTNAPASGQLTLKVDYGVMFPGLVNFSLINTLGPFFTELQGAASGAQFFYSWSADDFTYSPEASVSLNGNIGQWQNTDSPRFIKFRIVLTDTLESLPYGIKRLWLPALAVSEPVDGGSGIVSWDTWKAGFANNNGSIQRFTSSRYDITGQFSFHQTLGPGDTIQSGNFQVAQGFGMPTHMVFITLMNASGVNPPALFWNLFTLTTATILISMANMNSASVLDVIKELAGIADFEIGMDGSGLFFFRNKAPAATSLLTLNDSNVEIVLSISPGWDRVYNSIRASYGSFVKVADSASEGDPAPTSMARFGVRPLGIGGGNLIFETDVDLATVMARRYFARYKEPKRRITLVARFMPELELGDRVTFSMFIPRQIGQPFDARVLGIAHDLMSFRTELDLLETP